MIFSILWDLTILNASLIADLAQLTLASGIKKLPLIKAAIWSTNPFFENSPCGILSFLPLFNHE